MKKRDFIKELIEECNLNDIKPFLYYATLDWSWDYGNISFKDQLLKINQSIELLCKTYPGIKGFWFDGNWSRKDEDWEENKLYKIIRNYIPEAIIINNSGLTNAGKEQDIEVDSITYEQGHLSNIDYKIFKRDLAAEACQSFNDHWGYAEEDYNYKSVSYLILKFLSARKRRANYLLNLSINSDDKLQPIEVETLKIFNKWISKYGLPLLEEYEIIGFNNHDFIIKNNQNRYFVYLYNIPSGGHVKVIQSRGKIQSLRSINVNNFELEGKLVGKFKDNNEEIEIKFNKLNNSLEFNSTAFNYGFNTIVRVMEIIKS